MKTFMFVLRKIFALFCWIGSVLTILQLFTAHEQLVPYILFSSILWFYWGRVLWKNDERKIAINGFVYQLLVIAVFVAEFVACMLVGVAISGLMANFNPILTGWIFGILMTICLFALSPSKILPKRFFVAPESKPVADEAVANNNQEESNACSKPILKQFEESDHSKYMPK